MSSVLDEVRAQLLPATLEFCFENVPHYRATWPAAWREVAGVEDLAALPLLDKPTAIAVQRELRSGVPFIPNPILSSGTTRDGSQVLEVLHSEAELEASARFLAMLAGASAAEPPEDAPDDASGGARGPRRELVVINAHHGLPLESTSEHRILVPFLPHANSAVQVLRLLERVFDDDTRVEAMLISVTNLKVLTLWLLEQGIDPASFAVRNIGTNSSALTARWRERLGQLWSARLWDNYSLSEFRTQACECERCGLHHFDELPLVTELVDPGTGAVTAGPIGELVLSGLYPYQQAMPLIRYRTGDLVEVHRGCDTGEPGFAPLGRVRDCVFDDAGELVFAPRALLEVVDRLPEVARAPELFEQLGMIPPGTVGPPEVEVEALDGGPLEVRARLRFHPEVFPREAARVERTIEDALLADFPAVAARGLKVRARPPR